MYGVWGYGTLSRMRRFCVANPIDRGMRTDPRNFIFSARQNSTSSTISSTDSRTGLMASYRHARQLLQFNEDLYRQHVLTDVRLVVDGKSVRGHRAVLVCFSPYLRRKLIDTDGKSIVNRVFIPKVGKKEFMVLLHYMYTGNLNVSYVNFVELYEAASILEIKEVMQECIQLLDPNDGDDIKTYFFMYVISKKLGIRENWLRSLELLSHRFEEVVCNPEFLQLPIDYVVELLSLQSIGARSEVIVFLAALKWLNHKYKKRSTYELRLMECVRFSSMSMEEIVACYHPPFLQQILVQNNSKILNMLFKATCYITAKFLEKESYFKNFESKKRNLTFENLPLELWHISPTASAMNIAQQWEDTIRARCSTHFLKTGSKSSLHFPSEENSVVHNKHLTEALKQIIEKCHSSSSKVDISEIVDESPKEVTTFNEDNTSGQHKKFIRNKPPAISRYPNFVKGMKKEPPNTKVESLDTESASLPGKAKHHSSDAFELDTPEDLKKFNAKEFKNSEKSIEKTVSENNPSKETNRGSRERGRRWFFRK
ncbi:hypothetical protein JTE90_025745 [Oedothorax gibbosus]|uniref:BTB domain-containing protein n=1 Tax=Oedothorax gibbosus TaxID=931172 RepID=A0AAV6UUH4_9ARAC|nr:hypothetical protein JTE90_025745 [Oedothorax gibbosus]